MSYIYSTYVTALSELMVIPTTNVDFVAILPSIIDYGEQRIYRELDLLQTVVRDSSAALTSGNRNFTLPTSVGTFVVVDGINVITPSSVTNPELGLRNPLTPISRDFLDVAWPSSTGSTVPEYFAMITQGTIIVGPWPDAAYRVEVIGTQRPAALSVSNTTTFLATNLPDLFIAASMIFAAGYLKNFGAQGDDPRQAISWETQYQALKASAVTEEARKRFMGSAWSPMTQAPEAQPPRN